MKTGYLKDQIIHWTTIADEAKDSGFWKTTVSRFPFYRSRRGGLDQVNSRPANLSDGFPLPFSRSTVHWARVWLASAIRPTVEQIGFWRVCLMTCL
jgi:hypothetical protein